MRDHVVVVAVRCLAAGSTSILLLDNVLKHLLAQVQILHEML